MTIKEDVPAPITQSSFTGTVETDDGSVAGSVSFATDAVRLVIGNDQVGSWPPDEVDIVATDAGFELRAEGDTVIFVPDDAEGFSAAAAGEVPQGSVGGWLESEEVDEEPPAALIEPGEPDEYFAAGLHGPGDRRPEMPRFAASLPPPITLPPGGVVEETDPPSAEPEQREGRSEPVAEEADPPSAEPEPREGRSEVTSATDLPAVDARPDESPSLSASERARQWALVAVGAAVVLGLAGFAAWGVIGLLGGGQQPVATTVAAPPGPEPGAQPDPTLPRGPTQAPPDTVTAENAAAATAFVEAWNDLARRYAYHLTIAGDRLPLSTAPAPNVHLTYDEEGLLTLSGVPRGDRRDRDILVAMGLAVAWADPALAPAERKALLADLGVDVDDPSLSDVGGEVVRNGVTYRLELRAGILRLEIAGGGGTDGAG